LVTTPVIVRDSHCYPELLGNKINKIERNTYGHGYEAAASRYYARAGGKISALINKLFQSHFIHASFNIELIYVIKYFSESFM
jgi:hypothetical protein